MPSTRRANVGVRLATCLGSENSIDLHAPIPRDTRKEPFAQTELISPNRTHGSVQGRRSTCPVPQVSEIIERGQGSGDTFKTLGAGFPLTRRLVRCRADLKILRLR